LSKNDRDDSVDVGDDDSVEMTLVPGPGLGLGTAWRF